MISFNWASLYTCMILVVTLRISQHASANAEVGVLNKFKTNLIDINDVLSSWNVSMKNPCSWYHVTCNIDNSVTRIDLGNANLSGQLVPELGQLSNLQYLELFSNKISGKIPSEVGNLKNLVSLDLQYNNLDGPIPDTLGKLSGLRFLDLSFNQLSGTVPRNGSFSEFTPMSFIGNPNLTWSPANSTSA